MRDIEAEVKRLREENARLKEELEQFRKQESPANPPSASSDDYDEFIEEAGVLWKRSVDGRLEALAYCPTCRLVLLPVPSDHPTKLVCTRCKFEAPFSPDEIGGVAARIHV